MLWYFTEYQPETKKLDPDVNYWFIYPLFGWAIGLAFHYWNAYYDDDTSVDKEFKRMKKRQETRTEKKDTLSQDSGKTNP